MGTDGDDAGGRPPQEGLIELDGGIDGVDPEVTRQWLSANVEELEAPIELRLIAAGGSNLTYLVRGARDVACVLRRPPVGQLQASAHDVLREMRIMEGLAGTAVPVPRILAASEDLSVVGAPFYVMAYEEGWIIRDRSVAEALGPARCEVVARELFTTLADLHLLDPASCGLDTLSRPTDYIHRQLRRWHRQYETIRDGDPHPLYLDLHDRLAAAAPADLPRSSGYLVHGDFHIDNAVFTDEGRVKALIDWELSTLGHPVADLAWALMFWSEAPDEPMESAGGATLAAGFLPRSEVTAIYAERTGFDLADLSYFMALAYWRIGCLMEGSAARSRAGSGGGLQQAARSDGAGDAGSDTRRRIEAVFAAAAEHAAEAGI